jgi:hypothetical protein
MGSVGDGSGEVAAGPAAAASGKSAQPSDSQGTDDSEQQGKKVNPDIVT